MADTFFTQVEVDSNWQAGHDVGKVLLPVGVRQQRGDLAPHFLVFDSGECRATVFGREIVESVEVDFDSSPLFAVHGFSKVISPCDNKKSKKK